MKKNKLIYFLLIFIFTILVFSVTSTYLFIYKENMGSADFIDRYYDVVFLNVTSEDNLSLKLNGNVIIVDIDDVNELKTPKSFYLDIVNIGNINAIVDGIYVSNMSNPEILNNIKVETSILKGDILSGSDGKKLKVTMSYTGEEVLKKKLKFNINYLFKEVSL